MIYINISLDIFIIYIVNITDFLLPFTVILPFNTNTLSLDGDNIAINKYPDLSITSNNANYASNNGIDSSATGRGSSSGNRGSSIIGYRDRDYRGTDHNTTVSRARARSRSPVKYFEESFLSPSRKGENFNFDRLKNIAKDALSRLDDTTTHSNKKGESSAESINKNSGLMHSRTPFIGRNSPQVSNNTKVTPPILTQTSTGFSYLNKSEYADTNRTISSLKERINELGKQGFKTSGNFDFVLTKPNISIDFSNAPFTFRSNSNQDKVLRKIWVTEQIDNLLKEKLYKENQELKLLNKGGEINASVLRINELKGFEDFNFRLLDKDPNKVNIMQRCLLEFYKDNQDHIKNKDSKIVAILNLLKSN